MVGQALNFDPQTLKQNARRSIISLTAKVLDKSAASMVLLQHTVQPSTIQPTYSMAIIQARAEAHEFITCHRGRSKEQ